MFSPSRIRSFFVSFLLLAALGPAFSRAQSVPGGYTVGMPWEGAVGVQKRTSEIMAQQNQQTGLPHTLRTKPRLRPDFQNLPSDPQSPNVPVWPLTGRLFSVAQVSNLPYRRFPIGKTSGDSGADERDERSQAGSPAIQQVGNLRYSIGTPLTPQSLAINFTGATLSDTRSFPPDSMGAAGPAQFIVAVNGRVRSFNKATGLADGVLNADTDVFFGPVLNPGATNNFTSDPRIRYDRLSGRWFIVMIDVPGQAGSLPNHVLLAVSDSSVITSSSAWTFFSFQQDQVSPTGDTGMFADYPTLGIDANALYVGVNIFGTRGQGSFSDTTVFVIRKSSVLGAGPIVVTAFRGLIAKVQGHNTGPYTPQGVDNYDPAATEGYVVGVDAGFFGRLQLRRISTPGGTPSISGNVTVTIPLNGGTITVPHLGNTGGTSGNLDGLDYRLLGAHFRNGRLWTTENMAVDNTGSPSGTDTRMAVRWYELEGIPTGQTPSVRQSGTLYQPSASNTSDQRCYWMGTVMVSGQGHAALGFSVAGANEHANAGTVGRLTNDALGAMRSPVLYTASGAAYNPTNDPGGTHGRRWGDYSYTCLDPSDDMTFWTIQEFVNATDSYGVQVVKLVAPPPATPSSCNPSTVTNGVTIVTVVVTGTSDGDTGFFDPGPGFSNRVSAIVSGGGVAVTGVSYTDPTHVTLNLSVASGAASGARNITVTNPDGQSASSVGAILTVIGGANSVPAPVITAISLSNLVATISWSAVAGQTYRVQYKNALTDPSWSDLLPDITATNTTASFSDTSASLAQRFYRVKILP